MRTTFVVAAVAVAIVTSVISGFAQSSTAKHSPEETKSEAGVTPTPELNKEAEEIEQMNDWSGVSPDDALFAATRLIPDQVYIHRHDLDGVAVSIFRDELQTRTLVARHDFGGRVISHIEWSPDSKFLLFTTASSGGHQPWHAAAFLFCTTDNSFRDVEPAIGSVASPNFRFEPPDTAIMVIKKDDEPEAEAKIPLAKTMHDMPVVKSPAKEQTPKTNPIGGAAAAHTQRGIVFAQQAQYADAIDEFTKTIQADPNDPHGYFNRGLAKRTSGRLQDAVADFSKAIEISPNDEVAYRERGKTQILQQQFEAALSDLDKAIQLNPNDAYAYKFRGFAEIGLTQWDKAVADFTIAIQKEPDDWQNYDRRAWANRNLKHYGEAVADYAALIKKDPKDAERLVKRGATYTAMGKYKKAIADYEAGLKLAPRDSATVQRLKYAHAMLEKNGSKP